MEGSNGTTAGGADGYSGEWGIGKLSLMVLVVILLAGVIVVVLVLAGISAVERWLSRWLAILIGACAFGYIAYSMISGIVYCAAVPVYVPPSAAEAAAGSDGSMVFNCDSAGGMIDYLSLYLLAPMTLLIVGAKVVSLFRQARSG